VTCGRSSSFFFSSRRRHTRSKRDWSSDVCSSDLTEQPVHVLLMPVRSLLQPIATGLGDLRPVRAAVGDDYPLDDLVRDLVDAAYARVDMVERRGEFAVRGGILDVFPPTEPHPVRV